MAIPVRIRPAINMGIFWATAISTQPRIPGTIDIFKVLILPIRSITKPLIMDPMGATKATTLAIHDRLSLVTGISLPGPSSCGINIAEYARPIPTTIWFEVTISVAVI